MTDKEEVLKEMSMRMFAALADETPDPTVEDVDMPYAELDDEDEQKQKSRVYVDNPEEVPEGFEVQEGQQGGLYYEPEGSDTEDFSQEDWEQAGLEILEDFDEDDYRWSYWGNGPNYEAVDEGSIVEVMDEETFEQSQAVVIDANHEETEFAVVTESGELKLMSPDFHEADVSLSDYWDSPDQDNIRTGWDDDAVPDDEPEDSIPHWAEEEPLTTVEESHPPEGGFEVGELYEIGDDLAEAAQIDSDGDIPMYQFEWGDRSGWTGTEIDGVLVSSDPNGTDIDTDGVNYLEFTDESEFESDWYQIGDAIQNEDGDYVSYEVYSPEQGEAELPFEEIEGRDSQLTATHRPVEQLSNAPNVESLPEPSGSPDPDDWQISWDAVEEAESDTPRMATSEKKKVMREWKAAVDTEGAESVQDTIRAVKDGTYNTQGQKYDKLMQAVRGGSGEVRAGDFDDAPEPTPEEVEAMQVLQQASQKFFRDNFGEEGTVSRALADFSHERVFPAIAEVYEESGTLEGQELTLQDNPASVWTTDERAARTFTMIGEGTADKSLKVNEQVSSDEVFNMPDALVPYEEREEISGDDSDWNEGEINIPGSNRGIDMGNVRVVGAGPNDMHEVPISEVVESPNEVLERGDGPALEQFVETLSAYAPESFRDSYYERLLEDEEFREMDGADSIIETIEFAMERSANPEVKSESGTPVVDIRSPEDANWLYTANRHETTKSAIFNDVMGMLKARRYVNDPSDVPEGYDVQEGPQGGVYYETEGTSEGQSRIGPHETEEEEGEEEEEVEGPDYEAQAEEYDYEADVNEIVQSYLREENIDLTIPEYPDYDDVREAKEDWEEGRDSLKPLLDEGHDPDDVFEIVSVLNEKLGKLRNGRRKNQGSSHEQPEEVEELGEEAIEAWNGQVPDDYPDSVEPMYALADTAESYRQFRQSINQQGMMDISNRDVHRWGRALSGDPDYELPDLENLDSEEISPVANQDPETFRRISEARDGDGMITMYRAVPEEVEETEIGDYVALNPEYVERHGENVLGGQQGQEWHVLEDEVPIEDVGWPGEVADEFVYTPREIRDRWPSHKDFYEDVSGMDKRESLAHLMSQLDSDLGKKRVYISSRDEAPEGVQVQEGPQGGMYYETSDLPEEESSDEEDNGGIEWDDARLMGMAAQLNARFGRNITNSFMRHTANAIDAVDPATVSTVLSSVLSQDEPEMDVGVKKQIEDEIIFRTTKERVYVESPDEVPEGAEVQEGPQGGLYYEESGGESTEEAPSPDGEAPSAQDLISEVGLDGMDEVQEVIARGVEEGTDLEELGAAIAEEKSSRYVNRVLNDVEGAVMKDVDGYGNPVKMTYAWDDDDDFPREAERKFMDSVDEETAEMAKQSLETWPLDFFSEDMAPLWKTVMNETGNTNLLKDEEQVTETEVSEQEMDAIRAHKEHVEETLRDIHGDTITVYRGIYGDAGSKLQEAAESGEEVEWERRAVESYTTELTYAKSYAQNPGGVVVESEIPVEDVWASSHTGFLDANENELVVQKDEVETINPDNIHTPETLDDGAWNIKEVGEQARRFRHD